MIRTSLTTIGLAALLFCAACSSDPRFNDNTVYLGAQNHAQRGDHGNAYTGTMGRPPYDNVSYWDGDHLTGKPHITISLAKQRAYFYKGDQLAGVSVLSTGREGLNTRDGHFKIIQKDKNHASSEFGDYVNASGQVVDKEIDRSKVKMPPGCHYVGAPMPFFMRIVGGTGMHEGFLPGYPASHGCIRMPGFMAKHFFENTKLGTPVSVVGTLPGAVTAVN